MPTGLFRQQSAGEKSAEEGLLYSLLVTCKLNDVNPYEWLKDILSQDIKEIHINKIKELLPQNWKKNRP
ncbi:transposase domain-containing protein [Flavitalea flava]